MSRVVDGDNQMTRRLFDEWQKRAFLAAADIEDHLPRSAIDQIGHLEFVQRMQVPRERGGQAGLETPC